MDTNLRCNATRCIHNNENYCYAGRISIEGKLADDIDDTYCSTFKEKNYQQFTSSTGIDTPNPINTNQIKCDAIKCIYNNNKLCNANKIKINSDNASCDIFQEK